MESDKVDTRPRYEPPKITPMDQDEILQAFQMTAAEISAAGCWWTLIGCPGGNPL
jgi:hypothetical protein